VLSWHLLGLKNDSWFHFNDYIVAMNEGVDVVFVALFILMMHDMESSLQPSMLYQFHSSITTIDQHGHFRQNITLQLKMFPLLI
jgi:hypothetical protein